MGEILRLHKERGRGRTANQRQYSSDGEVGGGRKSATTNTGNDERRERRDIQQNIENRDQDRKRKELK